MSEKEPKLRQPTALSMARVIKGSGRTIYILPGKPSAVFSIDPKPKPSQKEPIDSDVKIMSHEDVPLTETNNLENPASES